MNWYFIFFSKIYVRTLINNTVSCSLQRSPAWWRHQAEDFFRLTGPLWGESTGHRWNPITKAVTRSFGIFFDLRQRVEQTIETLVIETPSCSLWRHLVRGYGVSFVGIWETIDCVITAPFCGLISIFHPLGRRRRERLAILTCLMQRSRGWRG